MSLMFLANAQLGGAAQTPQVHKHNATTPTTLRHGMQVWQHARSAKGSRKSHNSAHVLLHLLNVCINIQQSFLWPVPRCRPCG
jgi:hypothetical protein